MGGAVRNFVQSSTSPSPTTLSSILLINSVRCASAAFMSIIVCFKVLVFEPKTTVQGTDPLQDSDPSRRNTSFLPIKWEFLVRQFRSKIDPHPAVTVTTG